MIRSLRSPDKVAAIVVGLDLNGLGVVRSLAAAGVPIIALDTDLAKPTAATRYGEKLRVRALSGPVFVDDLLRLRPRFESNPVLLLTQESSVATVSAARHQLADGYRFALPDHAIVEGLLDKLHFQELAEKHGSPIPRAVRIDRHKNMDAVSSLRFPCVLKPTTKDPEYGRRFAKAYKVAGVTEVGQLWSNMREIVDEIIVQEWIEGDDSDIYFCLQARPPAGQPVSFVGRKICQWPILVGGTASCVPAEEVASELTQLTNKFFDAVGVTGLASMEYKREKRDGRFYMIEPTIGRTDFQEEIATLNGTNIPFAAYLNEFGIRLPEHTNVSPARAWRDPYGYALARMAGAQDRLSELSPGARVCDAYFRISDPMPYVASRIQGVWRRLSRLRPVPRDNSNRI